MLKPFPSMGRISPLWEALDHMLRTKLPRGIPLCIHLMSSQLVGDRIEYGLRGVLLVQVNRLNRFNAIGPI